MDSRQHFNAIAQQYDFWKEKNAYYHTALKKLLSAHIPEGKRVLEIGCGTGSLLASLKPSAGLGIDISEAMVASAQKKYGQRPELTFKTVDIRSLTEGLPYEYIFLADVLEHVADLPEFLTKLRSLALLDAEIIVTLANPIWEPLLMLSEKLHLKMPEGPHWRLSIKSMEKLFHETGFAIIQRGYDLLVPKPLPGANFANKYLAQLPGLKKLDFIVYWKIRVDKKV